MNLHQIKLIFQGLGENTCSFNYELLWKTLQ